MEFLLGLFLGSILRPTLKSVSSLMGAYTSRILVGLFYYTMSTYPDMINFTVDIFYEDEHGVTHHDIDSLVEDIMLSVMFLNPFVAYQVRRSFYSTTAENPLPLYHEARRRPRWLKKLLHSRFICWLRQATRCSALPQPFKNLLCVEKPTLAHMRKKRLRYFRLINSKLVGMAGRHTTNDGAMKHALGIPSRKFRFVVAHTAEKGIPERDQHHRVMLIAENRLLNLPQMLPVTENPHLVNRFQTLQKIAERYRRHPEEFGILFFRVPEHELRAAGLLAHAA